VNCYIRKCVCVEMLLQGRRKLSYAWYACTYVVALEMKAKHS
jgi:hypothetical protein